MPTDDPDLTLGGFSLWALGRERPDDTDYWDGNWLIARARIEAGGATVEARGPFLHLSELESFATELDRLDRTLSGEAALHCMEPTLDIVIRAERLGTMTARVALTPDHLNQAHEVSFAIDQSYLKPLLVQCRQIAARYPIVGTPDDAPPPTSGGMGAWLRGLWGRVFGR